MRLGLTGAAFVGAVAGVLLTLVLARGVQHTLRLLLAGVVGGWCWAPGDLVTMARPTSCRPCRPSCWAPTGFVGWTACAADGRHAGATLARPGLLAPCSTA